MTATADVRLATLESCAYPEYLVISREDPHSRAARGPSTQRVRDGQNRWIPDIDPTAGHGGFQLDVRWTTAEECTSRPFRSGPALPNQTLVTAAESGARDEQIAVDAPHGGSAYEFFVLRRFRCGHATR
jgi:hypothetical protein